MPHSCLIRPVAMAALLLTALVVRPAVTLGQVATDAAKPAPADADEKKDAANKATNSKEKSAKPDADGWDPLFNGKDLKGWKETKFGGEGEVYVENGNVVITQGVDLSGVTSTRKDLPKSNYEVTFEAQRALGSDFFIGFTFPVKESSCSLICGGWGGGVCGLSSLDGMDASENETTSYSSFKNGTWHKVRLRVTDDRIEAWLDKHQIVDVETADRKIDVRFEVDASKPMGFCTYQSTAWIRNAKIRTLPTVGAGKKKDAPKATK